MINVKNILLYCIIMASVSLAVYASPLPEDTDYGLYFNADQSAGNERTQLYINDGKQIGFKEDLTVDFDMMVRQHGIPFGSIAHIALDNGQIIRLIHATDEKDRIRPALVYNNALTYLSTDNLHKGNWMNVSVKIVADKNNVIVRYADIDTTLVVPVKGAKSAVVTMGRMDNYNSDIVPMNLKDIRISTDGRQRFYWKLGKHNDDICLDSMNRAVAKATFPKWLIDNHREWSLIYTDAISGNADIAFNRQSAQIYITRDNEIDVIDEEGSLVCAWSVNGSPHTASCSGHAVYDPITAELVFYSLSLGVAKRFSTQSLNWTVDKDFPWDPLHYNHARAFNPADSSYYFFGGYGHYAYRNELYRLSPGSDVIERVNYANLIPPRFGAAMTAVDNKLYILGGRGNEAGKQALETYFYYDLWEIDLKTLKARKVWEYRPAKDEQGWMFASSMIKLPGEDALYALNMDNSGGTLLRYSMNNPEFSEVSRPINNTNSYQNFDFSLYYSPEAAKFFLIIHKITVSKQHTISIYSLSTPLLHDAELKQMDETGNRSAVKWYWVVVALLLIAVAVRVVVWAIKKKKQDYQLENPVADTSDIVVETVQSHEPAPADEKTLTGDVEELIQEEPVKQYYDASKSSIVLIGGFSVHDKDGNDITASITPKLKELLLLMIFASKKYDRGISVGRVTEVMWYDKEGSSVRNNRNVTVRKLRIILESIGDIELSNQGGFMKLSIPESVYCDYNELYRCVEMLENRNNFSDDESFDRMLEILLGGALLPNTFYPWLDEYKSAFSNLSIDILISLLHKALKDGNNKMVFRIVRVMFIHDPLSEKALSAYCRTLVSQGKRGIAKKVYDRFCKEYLATMAEPFDFSFNDVLIGKCEGR